MTCIVHNEKLR